ncbi:DUF2510 domain-containing protein, partial [Streptomyces sp. NPDC001919]
MATPPGGGEEVPQAGYYPDPSIPGYIRYWNGGAWVPGTSRPAPTDGEVPPGPPASAIPAGPILASGPAPAPAAPAQPARPEPEPARSQPERQPHQHHEPHPHHEPHQQREPQPHHEPHQQREPQPHHEPQRLSGQQQPPQPAPRTEPARPAAPVPAQDRGPAPLPAQDRAPALAPVPAVEETGPFFFDEEPAPAEPASAWQADTSRQTGFGGDLDRKVSWGAPRTPDPRTPADWPVAGAGESEPDGPARAAAPAAPAAPATDPRATGGAARLGGMPVTPIPAPAPEAMKAQPRNEAAAKRSSTRWSRPPIRTVRRTTWRRSTRRR